MSHLVGKMQRLITMKPIYPLSLLLALGLSFGCKPAADNQTSTDTINNTPRASNQDTSNVAPTSSESNSPNRVYANDANTKDADNTGRNVRDRSGDSLTPGDQSNSQADIEVTRQIRRSLTKNDQLSTTAKNIKIITDAGKVTLRGPVQNEQEKKAIEDAVKNTPGVTSVDNQLELKSANQ